MSLSVLVGTGEGYGALDCAERGWEEGRDGGADELSICVRHLWHANDLGCTIDEEVCRGCAVVLLVTCDMREENEKQRTQTAQR